MLIVLLKYGRVVEISALDMFDAVDADDFDDLEFLRFLLAETRAPLLLLADRDLLEMRCDLADDNEVLGCCMAVDLDSVDAAAVVCLRCFVEVLGLDVVVVDAGSEEREEDGDDGEM